MKILPPTEAQARADLAAAFRWAARLDWSPTISALPSRKTAAAS
jgi:hypothetical protein